MKKLLAWFLGLFSHEKPVFTGPVAGSPPPTPITPEPQPPAQQGWANLIALYRASEIALPLKIASLAQWIIESGRGRSDLALLHHNYAGIKYRPELRRIASKVNYRAHDGEDSYAKFETDQDFIKGYWAFIGRAPYKGWELHADTALEFLTFLKNCGYAEDSNYIEKVSAVFAEAATLLGHDPRLNRDGQPVGEPPAPEDRIDVIPDFKNDGKPHIYPLNTRYEADPDVGGVMSSRDPSAIVIHHTVSYNTSGTIAQFKNNLVDIHFLVGHKGEVIQMAPCNRKCAHAGQSTWKGRSSLNEYAIGIEVVNIGPLSLSNGVFKDYYGRIYKGEVRERKAFGHTYWEPFTKAQEQAVQNICLWAIKTYGIKIDNIIGHYECSPGRKNDPAGGFSHGLVASFRDHLRQITGQG